MADSHAQRYAERFLGRGEIYRDKLGRLRPRRTRAQALAARDAKRKRMRVRDLRKERDRIDRLLNERPIGARKVTVADSIGAGSGTPLDKARRQLKLQGLPALLPGTQAAKDYEAMRDRLIDQYGGPDEVTPAQLFTIEDYVRGRIIGRHVDALVLARLQSGKPLTNRGGSKLLPIVLERYIIYKSLAATMGVLGLERKRRIRSLAEDLQASPELLDTTGQPIPEVPPE
jgi:hypothetical protein